MKVSPPRLFGIISGAANSGAPTLVGVMVSPLASPQLHEGRLTLTRPMPQLRAPGWWHALAGSLALWAVACAAAVVVLHNETRDMGPRIGAYPTGIATLVLFALAAVVSMRRRIFEVLPRAFVHGTSRHTLQENPASHNFSYSPSALWSIKHKTWQRIHIALAIGAMLPFWWHCDLRRASIADRLLSNVAILLVTSGFLGITITDLTRWRLLSPRFSPRLSAGLIKGLFIVHRGIALLTFTLIAIHVLAVLYFAGV
jgi:hypothetical protein